MGAALQGKGEYVVKHGPSHGRRMAFCHATSNRKVRFKSLKDAKIARSSRLEHESAEYLRIYKCPHCGGFHLTSQKMTGVSHTDWKEK